MRKLIFFITAFFFMLGSVQKAQGGGFYLKSIGQLDVQSSTLTHYWYSGTDPVLTGLAPAGSNISFEVNGVFAGSSQADESGNWSHTVSLNPGDNAITITPEGVGAYTFTLTSGEVPEGIGGAVIPEPETPPAGVSLPTLALLSTAVIAMASAFILRKSTAPLSR